MPRIIEVKRPLPLRNKLRNLIDFFENKEIATPKVWDNDVWAVLR